MNPEGGGAPFVKKHHYSKGGKDEKKLKRVTQK